MSADDLTLFELGEFVATPPSQSIEEAFADFHRLNPWVYHALVRLARQVTQRGHSRIGIGMLFEVLRWEWYTASTAGDYKLNNNYRSRYARLIAANEPDLADVFETRELRAA
jgi:hypothetical protein